METVFNNFFMNNLSYSLHKEWWWESQLNMVKHGTEVLEIFELLWNRRENVKQQRAVFFGDRHSQGILLLQAWNGSSSRQQPGF